MEVLVHSRIGGSESIQAVLLWASNACSIRLAFASELDGRYGSSLGIGKAEGGGGTKRKYSILKNYNTYVNA